jgi:hypothetical protein
VLIDMLPNPFSQLFLFRRQVGQGAINRFQRFTFGFIRPVLLLNAHLLYGFKPCQQTLQLTYFARRRVPQRWRLLFGKMGNQRRIGSIRLLPAQSGFAKGP